MKRVFLSLVTILAVGGAATGATGAFFTSTATSSSNTFASGTMTLALSDNNQSASASIDSSIEGSNLAPGSDIPTQTITVQNTGTISAHHLDLQVTLDNDNDLAKNIVFKSGTNAAAAPVAGQNVLWFGPTSGQSVDIRDMVFGFSDSNYTVTKADGTALPAAATIDTNADGELSLSELAALGKIRITPAANNQGIAAGTTATLSVNTLVKNTLVAQGSTVNATFTLTLDQNASQF